MPAIDRTSDCTIHEATSDLHLPDGILVLRLGGRHFEAPDEGFSGRAEMAIRAMTHRDVIVDLTGCSLISSATAGFLTDLYHRLQDAGVRLLVPRPNPRVLMVLDVLGLTETLLVVDDLTTALGLYHHQRRTA